MFDQTPIAIYSESFMGVRHSYELYRKRLLIYPVPNGLSRSCTEIPLQWLDSEWHLRNLRSPIFHGGKAVFLIGLIGIPLYLIFLQSHLWLLSLLISLSIGGALSMFAARHRINYAVFTGIIEVRIAGLHAPTAELQSFAEKLSEQIAKQAE